MTATVIASFLEHGEGSVTNNKMNSLGETQLTSATCSSAGHSYTPIESLLDGKVAEAPSPGGLFQHHHSVIIPSTKFIQNQFVNSLKMDPSVLLSNSGSGNISENHFREHCYLEAGDGLQSGNQVCVGVSSQVNTSRYKTELCRPYEENGSCKYGDRCQFAHGLHELRCLSRHPKYKTDLCRTFHTIGFCPYGPRCHFIHNAEERRGPPPISSFNKVVRPRLQHSFSFAGFPSSGSLEDSPTSVTPPPAFSTENLTVLQSRPLTYSSQELTSLFGPSLEHKLPRETQGLFPSSPTTPYFFQPTSESPPIPPDSLSDQEGYQSSMDSQSGSESPLHDALRRLPIFSRLSITDD